MSGRCHESLSLRGVSHKRYSEESVFSGEARFWYKSFGRRDRLGGDAGCEGDGQARWRSGWRYQKRSYHHLNLGFMRDGGGDGLVSFLICRRQQLIDREKDREE